LQKPNTFGVALRKKPSHPKCNPEPEFRADANKSLKRSYCIYELRFWIEDAQNGVHNIKSQVLYEIWRLFRQEGIQIPYPKRDLFMRSDLRA
jgi:small-conductance mechanosensitive channel